MTSKEKLQQIRAEQDAQEQIAEEVRERVGESVWDEILRRNQYESIKRGEALTFFRDSGFAQVARSAQVVNELHKWGDSAQVAECASRLSGWRYSHDAPRLSITSGVPADA